MTGTKDNHDEGGGGQPTGAAGQGALASGTYNDRGDVTGPDSPARGGAAKPSRGAGQGDDLADRLGGGEGRGTGLGGGGTTGAMNADRSGGSDTSAAPSGGDPGGLGGARAAGGTGTGRPPGGVSPVQSDQANG